MTSDIKPIDLIEQIANGELVPYVGPATLTGVTEVGTGVAIPADGESLILEMNGGKPMAPRLMYEFPRAAMNQELKKGRKFLEKFLTKTYGERKWSGSAFHQWLFELKPQYIVDINRDTQFQDLFSQAGQAFTLIVGMARISGTDYRFKIYQFDGQDYKEIEQADLDQSLPILFKPMGSPVPEANYVASDADYVDYITELMGGFAIPAFVKLYRQGKRYAFFGMDLSRDTERMVMSDIVYGAAQGPSGYVVNAEPSEKELRFFKKKDLALITMDWQNFIEAASTETAA